MKCPNCDLIIKEVFCVKEWDCGDCVDRCPGNVSVDYEGLIKIKIDKNTLKIKSVNGILPNDFGGVLL